MYVEGNVEARSRKHFCRGKAISSTYFKFVLLASGIQHARRIQHNAICVLTGSTMFFCIIL